MATSKLTPLGSRIRQAREDAGLSAEKLAPIIGVSMATMFRYERGQTDITLKRLARIAQATGKPLPWFLNGDTEQAA